MATIKSIIKQIELRHAKAIKARATLVSQQKRLEKAGLKYGSPSFKGKQNNQMRIELPRKPGVKRSWEYVGVNIVKQKEAHEALKRGAEYVALGDMINKLDVAIINLTSSLGSIVDNFDYSLETRKCHTTLEN